MKRILREKIHKKNISIKQVSLEIIKDFKVSEKSIYNAFKDGKNVKSKTIAIICLHLKFNKNEWFELLREFKGEEECSKK